MALLTISKRKKRFKLLGLGEYSKENILKLQKKYFVRTKDCDGVYGVNTDKLLRHVYNVYLYAGDHFKPEEFRCGCNGRYCTGYPTYMRASELANLKTLRTHLGRPISISCGMRCRPFNDSLRGSSKNSAHLSGRAVDFYISGHTNSLENRKTIINYLAKLPFFSWAYCNEYSSIKNYYPSAPNMGNAIHFDSDQASYSVIDKRIPGARRKVDTKTVETKPNKTSGQLIAETADKLAYSTNTGKAKYPSGTPKPAYKEALNKVYPNRGSWGKPPRAGASCDVFVGTCIRASGVDTNFPRGLAEQIPYLAKSSKFKRVSRDIKKVKDGDIIVYTRKGGGGHIVIVSGGKIKEASYNSYYGITTPYLKQRLSTSGKNFCYVYRAK